MGSQESKLEESIRQKEESKEPSQNDNTPSTPILTPLDPRSPSVNIARTPLELILASKTSEDCADITDENDECVTKKVVLGIDPRSPTVEFNRTPIIVSTVTKEKSSKLQNKNFDNVRKSIIQTTPVTSAQKTSNIIPPKLLGSSPIFAVPNSNKRKSLVGLLETNIDFTETDLDSVCRVENNLSKDLPVDDIVDDCKAIELNNQIDDLEITSGTESELISEDVLNKSSENETEEETVEESGQKEKMMENLSDTDKIPDEKIINVTAHVKDFDKKLTTLIYQDYSEDDSKLNLRFYKVKDNNRTPLGVRNSNEETKKSTNKLKVSDRPRKVEISKIPVFKDKHGKKIGIQCENTPPTKLEEKIMKGKMSQWDADKTLII